MTNALADTLIAVDIGNSTARFHLYRNVECESRQDPEQSLCLSTSDVENMESIHDILKGLFVKRSYSEPLNWYVSTVRDKAESRLSDCISATRGEDCYRRLTNHDVPIEVAVPSPDRVGIDRLLAASAVNHLREPDRPAIVIDAGSAVTIDLISADGAFQGGAILPGIRMQFGALAASAEKLPLVDLPTSAGDLAAVGKSTEAAVRAGVLLGIVGAVRGIVDHITESLNITPELFVTGGDMRQFERLANQDMQLVEDLVAYGILLTVGHFRRK